MGSEISLTRVHVHYPGNKSVHMGIDDNTPFHDIITHLVRFGTNEDYDLPKDTEWEASESPLFTEFIDREKTPAELDVENFTHIYLVPNPDRVKYTPLQDDLADSIVVNLSEKYDVWNNDDALALSRYIVPGIALVVSFVCGWVGAMMDPQWFVRAPLSVFLALAGILAITYTVPLINTRKKSDPSRAAGVSSAVAGYILIGTAGLIIIPGEFSPYNLICAGTLILASALVLKNMLIDGLEIITAGALGFSGLLMLTGTLSVLMDLAGVNMSVTASSVLMGILSLVLIVMLTDISLIMAKVPLPYVPATGDTFAHDKTADISSIPPSADAEAIKNLINNESNIIREHQVSVGLAGAGVLGVVLSTAVSAGTMAAHPYVVASVSASIVVAMTFIASAIDDRLVRGIITSGSFITGAAFVLTLLITGSREDLIGPSAIVLLAVTALGVVMAVLNKKIKSPDTSSFIGALEGLLMASILIQFAIIIDLYLTFRNG